MPWITFPERWIDEQGGESICEVTVYVTGATSGPFTGPVKQWLSCLWYPLASELRQEDSRRDAAEVLTKTGPGVKASSEPGLHPTVA